MKKIAMILILIIFAVPAFAMERISDDALNNITAQAGVSLDFAEGTTSIEIGFDGLSWGDDDGISGDAAHIRVDGTILAKVTVDADNKWSVDVDDVKGVVISASSPVTIDLTMNDTYKISLGSGVSPDWSTQTSSSQTFGHLSMNNFSAKVTAPGLSISAH